MSDTLAAILEAEADWHSLPSSTPPNILRLLERCLAKDTKHRMRDIADARIELAEPVTRSSSIARDRMDAGAQPGLTTTSMSKRLALWLAASGVVIAGAVLGWRLWPDASPGDPLAGATFKRLTDWDGAEQQVAMSRDGKFVAFISDRSGTWDAWVGQIGADSFSNLTNGRAPELRNHEVPNVGFTPDGSLVTLWVRLTDPANRVLGERLDGADDWRSAPAWSPDGQWIAVAANRGGQPALFKLPITGGVPVLLVQGFALDPVWSPSGRFLIYSGADVGTTLR